MVIRGFAGRRSRKGGARATQAAGAGVAVTVRSFMLSWKDAQEYVRWLSAKTGERYRRELGELQERIAGRDRRRSPREHDMSTRATMSHATAKTRRLRWLARAVPAGVTALVAAIASGHAQANEVLGSNIGGTTAGSNAQVGWHSGASRQIAQQIGVTPLSWTHLGFRHQS